jgi:hypothetical protein
MKYIAALVLALLLLMSPKVSSAQMPKRAEVAPVLSLPEVPAEPFETTLSHAVLGVYHAKQECAWVKETFLWFQFLNWKCEFKENFTCTATIIYANPDLGEYMAITAGHCFDWKELDNYYVSDGINEKPVMHKAIVQKFENDERYDYAVLTFRSLRPHPAIELEVMDADGPALGTKVININYSLGIVQQVMHGEVNSAIIQSTEGGECAMCRGRYLVSIGIGPGASGSAVVDADTHKIVGFAEGHFPDTMMPALVIPAGKRLGEFLDDDSAGIKPLPEGPKPVEGQPVKPGSSEDKLRKLFSLAVQIFFRYIV